MGEKGGVTLGGIWSFPPELPALPAPPAQLGEMSRSDPSLAGSEFDFELVLRTDLNVGWPLLVIGLCVRSQLVQRS